jgi:hypothetical protein
MTSPSERKEQAERKAVLDNDRKVREGATFLDHARAEASEPRGRFSATNKETVVGSMPTVNYPAAPNWSPDPVPPEPSLGVEVDAQEAVGTPQEIEASIKKLEDQS